MFRLINLKNEILLRITTISQFIQIMSETPIEKLFINPNIRGFNIRNVTKLSAKFHCKYKRRVLGWQKINLYSL